MNRRVYCSEQMCGLILPIDRWSRFSARGGTSMGVNAGGGGTSMTNLNVVRDQVVTMLDAYPPRLWSANLLAAVAAVVRVEFPADDVSDAVSQVTRRVG